MKKYSIFHSYPLAFFSRDLYRDVGRNWKGICFFYLLLLLLVTSIPLSIQVHLNMTEFAREEAPKITSQFPPITVKNGEVSIDAPQPCYIKAPDSDKIAAILDTTGEYIDLKNSDAQVLLTKHEIITRKSDHRFETYDLSQVPEFYIDRQKLDGWIELFRKWVAVVFFGAATIGFLVYRLVQALIYGLIGMIFTNICSAELNYGALVRLSIISVTPVIIADTILNLASVQIPYWTWIGIAVTMFYLFLGVKANAGALVQQGDGQAEQIEGEQEQ